MPLFLNSFMMIIFVTLSKMNGWWTSFTPLLSTHTQMPPFTLYSQYSCILILIVSISVYTLFGWYKITTAGPHSSTLFLFILFCLFLLYLLLIYHQTFLSYLLREDLNHITLWEISVEQSIMSCFSLGCLFLTLGLSRIGSHVSGLPCLCSF